MADQPRRTAAENASEAESETAATNKAEDESAVVATTAAAAVTVTGSEAICEANHRAAMNGRRSTRKMRAGTFSPTTTIRNGDRAYQRRFRQGNLRRHAEQRQAVGEALLRELQLVGHHGQSRSHWYS
jgi:hypothetical protein